MDQHPWDQAQQSSRDQRRQARWQRRAERRACRSADSGVGGMFFGLVVVVMGCLFLLNNLGVIYIADIFEYWPVIPIALGLCKVTAMRSAGSVAWGLIMACVGTVLLLKNLDIIYGNVWQFIWPTLIIGWGLSLLGTHFDWWQGGGPANGMPNIGGGSGATSSTADRVSIDVLFGGDRRRVVSQNFQGGRCSSIFGGIELDLRGAAMTQPEAVIHADSVFGGVDIRIPETWVAEVRGAGVFGGYVDKTMHTPPPAGTVAPRLIVKGGAVFGGVNVRN